MNIIPNQANVKTIKISHLQAHQKTDRKRETKIEMGAGWRKRNLLPTNPQ